jgi:hypothetical protein
MTDLALASQWYEGKHTGLDLEFLEEVDKAIERIESHPRSYLKV